jgi:hypothetical protein
VSTVVPAAMIHDLITAFPVAFAAVTASGLLSRSISERRPAPPNRGG